MCSVENAYNIHKSLHTLVPLPDSLPEKGPDFKVTRLPPPLEYGLAEDLLEASSKEWDDGESVNREEAPLSAAGLE